MSDHGGESVIDSYIDLFLAGNNIPHRKLLEWYWYGMGIQKLVGFYRKTETVQRKKTLVFARRLSLG